MKFIMNDSLLAILPYLLFKIVLQTRIMTLQTGRFKLQPSTTFPIPTGRRRMAELIAATLIGSASNQVQLKFKSVTSAPSIHDLFYKLS